MVRTNSKGYTLIELIIVIAILGIVISLGFSFFFFGNSSFSKGQNQSTIQHSVRMASRYITDEIRTAKDVRIMKEKPIVFEEYNYIYVEGIKIIHRKPDGSSQEVFGSSVDGSIEVFFETAGDDNIVEFTISKVFNEQDFQVKSSVSSLNLTDPDTIEKDYSSDNLWRVIRYSDPIVDPAAVVRLDTLLLDLKELNAFLDIDTDGETLILDVPTKRPNIINLPIKGQVGSDISWNTTSSYLETNGSNRGEVYRRLWNEIDTNLIITATVSKEGVEKQKEFKLIIKKLEQLSAVEETLTLSVQSGVYFSHQISAEGGNPGYTFLSNNLPEGTTLDSNGFVTGIIGSLEGNGGTTDLSIPITIKDNHNDTNGILTPNVIERILTIYINE